MTVFPSINMEATGLKIKSLREKNGYTVRGLQKELGFATAQAIYKWQQGVTLPSIDNLVALSHLFHVRIEELLVCSTPAVITPFSDRSAA